MIRKLKIKEKDLLLRVIAKPELQPFFFPKANGLHWFQPIIDAGLFSPDKNPLPMLTENEGYVHVPPWPVIEYLIVNLPELGKQENVEQALKCLEIIRKITLYAQNNKFSNFRTWWQFSKIVSKLPVSIICEKDLTLFDYWLKDKYNCDFVAKELVQNWLPNILVKVKDPTFKSLAIGLLEIVFSVQVNNELKKAFLKIDAWQAKEIIKKDANNWGRTLGISLVDIFVTKLLSILKELDKDSWSSIWRGAIEEHDQNHGANDAEDILIAGCRDCLFGAIESDLASTKKYLAHLLKSEYQTIKRLAICVINNNFNNFQELSKLIIVPDNFTDNMRHEIWQFLNCNFLLLQDKDKNRVIEIINNLSIQNHDGVYEEKASAYSRLIWLSAIKINDKKIANDYNQLAQIAGSEPEHPEFSNYMAWEFTENKSPISFEKLLSFETTKLLEVIKNYKDPGLINKPGIEGLVKVFKNVVKNKASIFALELDNFIYVDLPYVQAIIDAFHELWNEKAKIQWHDIWPRIIVFCSKVISGENFWAEINSKKKDQFVADRHWVIASIGRLIQDGVRSDDHAFDPELINNAKDLIISILEKQEHEDFPEKSDAMFIAINSPRGSCLEAMLNLALRSCRLKDKSDKNYLNAWKEYEEIYNKELNNKNKLNFEFITILTSHLPHFLFMSKEWVIKNLNDIFDKSDRQKWLCAIQGFAHVNIFDKEVYSHLKNNGDIIAALDEDCIKDKLKDTFVQLIVVAYVNGYDTFSESMILKLLNRKKYEEISQIIWFLWTRKSENLPVISEKVFELWPELLKIFDFVNQSHKKLASALCKWVVFIEKLNDLTLSWLLIIAPYAGEEYNCDDLLENLARISNNQPFEAATIWQAMLKGKGQYYYANEESIQKILENLVIAGPDGTKKAREIIGVYISFGVESPRIWLKEIMKKLGNRD